MSVVWLSCDKRRREAEAWRPWFDLVPRVRREFQEAIDDDPFFYNETASVGVLANAASRAGFLTLSEFSATKRGSGRGLPLKYGRCDLWIADRDGAHSWVFEFKQHFCSETPRLKTLTGVFDRACKDAYAVDPIEGDQRFGALLVSAKAGARLNDRGVECVEDLAKTAKFACRFDGTAGPIWLMLRDVRSRPTAARR